MANGTCRAARAKLSERPAFDGEWSGMLPLLIQRHGGLQDCIEALEVDRLR